MDSTIWIVIVAVAGVAGYASGNYIARQSRLAGTDSSLFVTTPGDDGFCRGRVKKTRMRGRAFLWQRQGMGCRPSAGDRFEIRVKSGQALLEPPVPSGVDRIYAEVRPDVAPGTVVAYGLWMVKADGAARELEDPELEIGPFLLG